MTTTLQIIIIIENMFLNKMCNCLKNENIYRFYFDLIKLIIIYDNKKLIAIIKKYINILKSIFYYKKAI